MSKLYQVTESPQPGCESRQRHHVLQTNTRLSCLVLHCCLYGYSLYGYISLAFTFKNTSLDKVWGFKLMRWFREIKPAAENTRSALAEPLGILYILRATFARRGKDLELAFQNPMTSLTSSGFNRGDERKLSTSLFTSHSPAGCGLSFREV